jgi:crossover junction endodeoxyribonuclease RuvC
MRVISIDPGYDRIGIAVMELENDKEKLIHSSCIETNKKEELFLRLTQLGKEFDILLQTYSPTAVAIETLFFNKNVKTAMGVAQARGILIYLSQIHNCALYEFGPQEIKIAVTGYGKSDKGAVIDMVKRLVPAAPDKALDDEYDAIAVGITCLAHYGRTE